MFLLTCNSCFLILLRTKKNKYMKIYRDNVTHNFYANKASRALELLLSTSYAPLTVFLKISRMSIYDALVFVANSVGSDSLKSFVHIPRMPSLLENFKVSEFFTGLFSDPNFSCVSPGVYTMFGRSVFYVLLLNELRKDLSKLPTAPRYIPIVINSGYRSVSHNANVGGVSDSNHIRGTAIDVACPVGVPFSSFEQRLKAILDFYSSFYKSYEFIPYRKQRFIHISF